MAKDNEEGKEGQHADGIRPAGAPPKGAKKKKKGIRAMYANGKDGLRQKV